MLPPESKNNQASSAHWFQTTHWSVVLTARDVSANGSKALEILCRDYWYPIYSHVRRRGHDPESAKDLTQEFFLRLLEKNWLQTAQREKGRFRTFLLCAIERFLSKEREKAGALKRGGNYLIVSWDNHIAEERFLREPQYQETPEKTFDRHWALSVLDKVIHNLQNEYSRAGKTAWFELLQVFLSGEPNRGATAEIADKLNISDGAVRVAAHRLKQRYGQMLRQEIANTLSNEHEIDEEIRYLLSVLTD